MKKNGQGEKESVSKVNMPEQALRPSSEAIVEMAYIPVVAGEQPAASSSPEEQSMEMLEQAWARRAAQMAKALEEEDRGEQVELAIVRLGREIYGLEVQYVYDIRTLENITRVPRVSDWVAGVVNLRGRIISALDLKRFLGIPKSENPANNADNKQHLVVVEVPEMELALLVDEVLTIDILPAARIQEASSAIRGIRSEYVRGVIVPTENGQVTGPKPGLSSENKKDGNNGRYENPDQAAGEKNSLLVVLDLPALLADKRLVIHEEII